MLSDSGNLVFYGSDLGWDDCSSHMFIAFLGVATGLAPLVPVLAVLKTLVIWLPHVPDCANTAGEKNQLHHECWNFEEREK